MLSVDQAIVNGHITIFNNALILMFGSYYCMNISYPVTQAATLEFLQRCLKINPKWSGTHLRKTLQSIQRF
ncbi:unnamed protein product [Oreochromis niloticus]|nr:unnamed protein product [Mustela putorius furo]